MGPNCHQKEAGLSSGRYNLPKYMKYLGLVSLNKNQLGKAHRKRGQGDKIQGTWWRFTDGGVSSRPICFKGHKIAPYSKGSNNSNLWWFYKEFALPKCMQFWGWCHISWPQLQPQPFQRSFIQYCKQHTAFFPIYCVFHFKFFRFWSGWFSQKCL